MLKKIISGLIAFLTFISPNLNTFFGLPQKVSDRQLDMSKFTMTWNDEFDGDSIDGSKWGSEWWVVKRNGGYWHEDMARVEDGNLIISAQYLSEPLENRYYEKWHDSINFDEYGAGYYSTILTTRDKFEQCYGYYEIRCKCNKGEQFWSAFWIQSITSPYDHYLSQGGVNGAEIDIFEAMSADKLLPENRNAVTTTIHCNGWDDDIENIDSRCLGKFKVENDIYEEYNTYGLEWNEDTYIFYINGGETGRITKGGVSDNPEYLILSCEVAGENGIANADRHGTGKISLPQDGSEVHFLVDYVRVYQYKDLI